jgi:putative protease
MKTIELLAPARDISVAIAAINCGADAVYIGAQRFGARKGASNTLQDIEKLVLYAHKFHARVYATVNTILFDSELKAARDLIVDLYNIGIDAIIFQDMAILEMDLPPVPLHASTQCDNYDIEKIKFLDKIGISRIVLARELSLEEIKMIRQEVSCELECFVHGSLCVSLSGRCYMSASLGGRSANRGECAQVCRKSYVLTDAKGKVISDGKHILSLKDMDRSDYLPELIESGITSFKIEGRLKDKAYVKNIVSYYRRKIDDFLAGNCDFVRSSSGKSYISFTPDPERTFNRGFTDYLLKGYREKLLSPLTPKSQGKYIGKIIAVESKRFSTENMELLNNGDGLLIISKDGIVSGLRVNKIEDGYVYPFNFIPLSKGDLVYRNSDIVFEKDLLIDEEERLIDVSMEFKDVDSGFELSVADCDKNTVTVHENLPKILSQKDISETINLIKTQLSKTGNSIFKAESISVVLSNSFFLRLSIINNMRRKALEELEAMRIQNYKREVQGPLNGAVVYPYKEIDYRWNVSNKMAENFYRKHGVEYIKPAFEIKSSGDENLMTSRMCLRYENDLCKRINSGAVFADPFILFDGINYFTVSFDCDRCLMIIKKRE